MLRIIVLHIHSLRLVCIWVKDFQASRQRNAGTIKARKLGLLKVLKKYVYGLKRKEREQKIFSKAGISFSILHSMHVRLALTNSRFFFFFVIYMYLMYITV